MMTILVDFRQSPSDFWSGKFASRHTRFNIRHRKLITAFNASGYQDED
jgi:hypothetical protein